MKYLIVAMSGILVSAVLFTIPAQAGEEPQKQPQVFDFQRALEVLVPKQEQERQPNKYNEKGQTRGYEEEVAKDSGKSETPGQQEDFNFKGPIKILTPKEEEKEQQQGWPQKSQEMTIKILAFSINEETRKVRARAHTSQRSFYFDLKDDKKLTVHQEWLDMIRDAFNNDWSVHVVGTRYKSWSEPIHIYHLALEKTKE